MKVEIEELESLLGPEDLDVDFSTIIEEARDKKGCAMLETFSSEGQSEFLVVSGTRWDKHQKKAGCSVATKFIFFNMKGMRSVRGSKIRPPQ